ncbi:MAG: hypothetical protein AB1410_02430 [Acidobacteriota bacterium]
MRNIDWIVVGSYLIIPLIIGAVFLKRAGRSIEDFFVAGRNLPWWIIGISAVATYTDAGLAPAVTMWVYQGGLLGNGVWWIPYVIWMPLSAVLWSKFWRRLKTVTTAEFLQIRYRGSISEIYRCVYAFFMSFGYIVVLMGYVSGWMSIALSPVLGWSPFQMILIAGVVTLIYTTMAGLYGTAYNDIYEFLIFLIGNSILVPFVLFRVGGMEKVFQGVYHLRGSNAEEFFNVIPPSQNLTELTIFAFIIQGMFFAASPTGGEGFTAQKFMAAKNEFHAQVGQLFNSALTLIIRVIPFIFLGIIAASIFPVGMFKEPGEIWANVVKIFAPVGLKGLLVAGIFAAYMSTIGTEMNWGASYVVNDIYRKVNRKASNKHYVLIGRIASIVIFILSLIISYLFVKGMTAWFLFINSVVFAFILPLSWLRFFWWRMNIYGEAAALILGLPLGYIIWFPLGFSNNPFWQGFLLLFGIGLVVIVFTALITPSEKLDTLIEFYKRCRPPGFWSPVTKIFSEEERVSIKEETLRDIIDCFLGITFAGSLILSIISIFGKHINIFIVSILVSLLSGSLFFLRWMRRGVFHSL